MCGAALRVCEECGPLTRPGDDLVLFKRARFLEAAAGRPGAAAAAAALAPYCAAASFDLIVNGTPSFFHPIW